EQQRAVAEGLALGRGEAWAALYDAYAEDAWRYAYRLAAGDRGATEEILQETFLAAARAARGFDAARGTLRSWLLGIVHLQTVQYFRRRGRDTRNEERGARSESQRVDPAA